MTLIKYQNIVEDSWIAIADEDTLPEGKPVLVGLDRWLSRDADLQSHYGQIGIRLPADADISLIAEDLANVDLITIEFASFTDGRGYSIARTLRQTHDFKGELRAVGQILRDQFSALSRCGFDAFEVDEGRLGDDASKTWIETTGQITHWYQGDTKNTPSVLHLRHGGAGQRLEPPACAAAWAY